MTSSGSLEHRCHSEDPHTNTLSFTPTCPFSSSCIVIYCADVCSAVRLWMLYRWLQVIVRQRAFLPLQSLDWVHLGQAPGYWGIEEGGACRFTAVLAHKHLWFLITALLKIQSHLCAWYACVTYKTSDRQWRTVKWGKSHNHQQLSLANPFNIYWYTVYDL